MENCVALELYHKNQGTEFWSAAACCRFPPRELARGDFGGASIERCSDEFTSTNGGVKPPLHLGPRPTIARQQAGSSQSGSKLPHSKASRVELFVDPLPQKC